MATKIGYRRVKYVRGTKGSNGVKKPSKSTKETESDNPIGKTQVIMIYFIFFDPKRCIQGHIKHKPIFFFLQQIQQKSKPISTILSQLAMNIHRNVHGNPKIVAQSQNSTVVPPLAAILCLRPATPKPKKIPHFPDLTLFSPSIRIPLRFSSKTKSMAQIQP